MPASITKVALIIALLGGTLHAQDRAAGDHTAVLGNQKLRGVFSIHSDGSSSENFYALDGNRQWKLILSPLVPHYGPADTASVQLWNTAINPYRYLVAGMKAVRIAKEKTTGKETISIFRRQGAVSVTEKISLAKNDSFFHIEISATLPGKMPKLDYLLSAYVFHAAGSPDFVHTPSVKFDDPRSGPGKDQVTGDRAFHSPAVILQQKVLLASLIPDLGLINSAKILSPDARRINFYKGKSPFGIDVPATRISMPSAIDLNLHSGQSALPVISYGMMDSKIGFHTRFIRVEKADSMVRILEGNRVTYGFDLFVKANAPEADYSAIAKHLWDKYGAAEYARAPHLAMPYAGYVQLVQKAVFNPVRNKDGSMVQTPGGEMDIPLAGYTDHGSWLEWQSDSGPMGGFRCAVPFWNEIINNTVFWNQARETTGMYYWGKVMADSFLIEKAAAMVNLCLSAPRNKQGLFATLYNAANRSWTIGWTDPPHNENKLFLKDSKSYEIPALCKTGAHLLDYYQRAVKDERIPEYLYPFADWLLSVIDERGIVPSFVTDDMQSSSILYESAQPAAALWFLAEMYQVTKQQKFLDGAEKIGNYIEREILPTSKWIDMEQYISCGAKPYTMLKDYWQDQWFRGTLCTIWACEGFASLHRATGKQRWLKDGEKSIDYLSFSQCCWNPHFIYSANPFGGFNTDNSDVAALMDQREAETVRSYVYFGKVLNRADLIERGIAAAEAGTVLIRSDRHIANGLTPHPLFYPDGLSPENTDHEGICQWPMRTHALWGEGSAVLTGLAEVHRSLGGIYADPENNIFIGADGIKIGDVKRSGNHIEIRAENFLSALYLKQPWEAPFRCPLRLVNSKGYQVSVNGRPVGEDALQNSITVDPGGDVHLGTR